MTTLRLLLVAMFVSGCAEAGRRSGASPDPTDGDNQPLEPPDPPAPASRIGELHFQVESDSALYPHAIKAAAAWSRALGCTVTASPDGDIPIFQVPAFGIECTSVAQASGHPARVNACSRVLDPPSAGHTEVLADRSDTALFLILLHEMGHHLQGGQRHLATAGNPYAVMIAEPIASSITPADVAWVCAGPRMACRLPTACGVVLSPEPALLEETTRVAARWSAATGCDVRVGENGTPVRLTDHLYDGDVEQPGRTLPLEGGGWEVVVTPLRLDHRIHGVDTVLMHEVGHAINPHDGHVEAAPGEPCTALMCTGGGLGQITAADIEYVCNGLPCATFAPEA